MTSTTAIPIQAAIGGRIIARETVRAPRKDVTAKCQGGVASRKHKLLDKPKEGKKKMHQFGKVEILREAFIAAMKMDTDRGEIAIMDSLRDRYFATLGISQFGENNFARVKGALDRAYFLRSFEIDLYWKRAAYFWGFQVAIFAAMGLIVEKDPSRRLLYMPVALCGVGILTAIASYLSVKGSKFWQKIGKNTSICSKTSLMDACTRSFGWIGAVYIIRFLE